MRRKFLSLLFAFIPLALALTSADAQDKKDKAKAPPRIAIDDPAKLTDDADFAAQGEYVGTVDGDKVGAHVVARGEGKFDIVGYPGGLPGDGWEGTKKKKMTGVREGAKVLISSEEKKQVVGELMAGVIKVTDPETSGELKKVERKSSTLGAKPPEGAMVLFAAAGDEKNWNGGKLIELSDGKFLNFGIKSKEKFGSFTAHAEFRLPWMPNSRGQGRANSGFYVQDRYEIQVLDSFGLKGENNECGGLYQAYKPLVNMCYPPMTWQTYDIDFTAAKFADGKKTDNARLTIRHNGVLIHDNVEMKGPSGGGQPETEAPGPIQLQNHGDPLVYRNIWVVSKK